MISEVVMTTPIVRRKYFFEEIKNSGIPVIELILVCQHQASEADGGLYHNTAPVYSSICLNLLHSVAI
jgi:hypothetical protein